MQRIFLARSSNQTPGERHSRSPHYATPDLYQDTTLVWPQRIVSEDQFILAQRVTQATTDNASLMPMVEAVEQNCKQKPNKVVADSGLSSDDNAAAMEQQAMDAYIPDSNKAAPLNKGGRVKGRARVPGMKHMRAKFRTSAGRDTMRNGKES
jgi:hypothetical protein